MIIGILETGRPPKALRPAFGSYPDMFKALLGPGQDYRVFDVRRENCRTSRRPSTAMSSPGHPPAPTITAMDRAAGALPARGEGANQTGRRLFRPPGDGPGLRRPGGEVFEGLGVGLQTYDIAVRESWMDDDAPIAIPVSHQDQVVEAPPDARVIGGNDFNPFGVLTYEAARAISLQCHPEFAPAYATALVEARAEQLGPLAAPAVRSLQSPNDCTRVGGWICQFLAQGR